MKRLLDLSYRYKVPLWGSLIIIATTLAVSGSLMFKAYDDLREDLFIRSSGLAYRLGQSLFQPMMQDDIWRLFDIISHSLSVPDSKDILLPSGILILDNELKVLVSTDPILIPMGTKIEQLTPEYKVLVARIQNQHVNEDQVYDLHDQKNYYVTAPIISDGYRLGSLVVVHSKDVLWPRFYRIASHGALTGLLVLAILLPANWYWGRRTSRPLVQIAECMKLLGTNADEDLNLVDYPYQDEVGQLFQAYRRMVVELGTKQILEGQVVHSERLAAVGHLAAGVAHEINNPLGGMLTAIDTLKSMDGTANRVMDPQTAKTISLIERGLTQIKETVGALLVEARVRYRHLDPQDFEDVRSLVLPQARNKGLKLDWHSSLARPVPLPANQVRQVLINLLLNAVNAANPSGLVSCSVEEKDDVLRIWVENDGDQMTADQQAHLFEPFSPLSKRGHGLGLWVTYQIVQQLGGSIVLEQPNGMVNFSVILPVGGGATA